jgi:hypothetical protein
VNRVWGRRLARVVGTVMADTRLRQATGRSRMTPTEITAITSAIGDLVGVLRGADPADKAVIYRHLGLKLTHQQEAHVVQVHAQPALTDMGFPSCPRPDSITTHMPFTCGNGSP